MDFVRAALADPSQAIFGAFAPRLVGVVGVYHGLAQKTAHKAHLWGLYVTPVHRGQRIGRALVEAALGFARSLEGVCQVHLSVAESALAAASLYEHLGFVTWGVEPSALRIGQNAVTERHMILALRTKAV